MRYELLTKIIVELSPMLSGARIDRVYEGPETEICLVLYARGKKVFLLAGTDRSLPRFHLVEEKPKSSALLRPFTQLLKSRTAGGTIEEIGLLNCDRIVELRITRQGTCFRLLFEMTGPSANMVLTDGSGTVLAVLYPFPASAGSARVLSPGRPYEPPVPKRFDAAFGPSETVQAEEAGEPDSVNRKTELLYRQILNERRFQAEKNRLRSTVSTFMKKTERRLQALTADAAAVANRDEYKRAGELILANLAKIPAGSARIELNGFNGESMTVSLDPARTQAANAELYFKKYRKARSGSRIIAERLARTEDDKRFLSALIDELERAASQELVQRISDSLSQRGYQAALVPRKALVSQGAETGIRTEHYQGWDILIGKSAAGNDRISTKIAKDDDLWLHAQGIPGSHVLVRNPERRPVPPDVLERAAGLAAYFSKGRNAGKVEVTYTAARFVKKPKGAKPGLVTLAERNTVMAVPFKGASES